MLSLRTWSPIEKIRTINQMSCFFHSQNLVFLIASGSRNLGRTCAVNIVKRGGRVVLCDKEDRKDTGEEIQDELGENQCLFVPADVSEENVPSHHTDNMYTFMFNFSSPEIKSYFRFFDRKLLFVIIVNFSHLHLPPQK